MSSCRATVRVAAQLSAAMAGLALVAACTHGSSDGSDSGESVGVTVTTKTDDTAPTQTAAPVTLTRPDVPLDVSIVQLRGGLASGTRSRLAEAVSRPVSNWITAGFLAGDYPRDDFTQAFDAWTPQAAALAQRDLDVTTNAALGPQLVAVRAAKQQVRLFIFAVHGITGGATARVALRFTGEKQDGSLHQLDVSGELYLTRAINTWTVFGYELHRAVSPR